MTPPNSAREPDESDDDALFDPMTDDEARAVAEEFIAEEAAGKVEYLSPEELDKLMEPLLAEARARARQRTDAASGQGE